jgi:hypothetical protein
MRREMFLGVQDLGSIGELISAIAVVISLVYLASQIRQNTRQIDENTKAAQAAAFDSSISQTFVARQMIIENEDVAGIYLKGGSDPEALSDEDLLRYRLIMHNILWSLWNMQSQAQVGELSAETWNAQLETLRRIVDSKGFEWFWASYSGEFGSSFQRVVAELQSERS